MTQNMNPLMSPVRIPGETFQLPSGGLFYCDGELSEDVVDGEVYVYPMTALDEILIKTPDLLFSGKAVEQIFNRCIPQVKKPLQLLARDVDYLLICLRSVSFGSEVTVIHNHGCSEDAKDHKYTVSIDDFMRRVKRIDQRTITDEYTCNMPDGKVVYISPMRYGSIVELMTSINPDQETILSAEDLHDKMIGQLGALVSRVTLTDGSEVVDQKFIREWLSSLPLPSIKLINDKIERATDWGPDTTFGDVCKDCKQKITITAPLNPMSFFI